MVPGRIQTASSDRVSWPVVLIAGLAGGLAWGVFARMWMRFISTDPQFTWNGTLFIVIGFGLAGLAQSAAFLGRRAHLRRPQMTALRVATFASLLPLGMAAGGPVFPTIVLAPLALTHTDWSRRTDTAVGAVAMLPVLFVARSHLGKSCPSSERWSGSYGSSSSTPGSSGPLGSRSHLSSTDGERPSRPRRRPGRIEHRVLALRLLAHRGPGLSGSNPGRPVHELQLIIEPPTLRGPPKDSRGSPGSETTT